MARFRDIGYFGWNWISGRRDVGSYFSKKEEPRHVAEFGYRYLEFENK